MNSDKVEILRIATRQVELFEYCRESEVLQSGPVFCRLSGEQQRHLLRGGKVAAYLPGQTILEAGHRAHRPALVLIGSVSLQTDFNLGLGLLGPGEMFGLEALFAESPSLGVGAREEVRLAWLETAAVRQLVELVPALGAYLHGLARSWQEQLREGADFFGRW